MIQCGFIDKSICLKFQEQSKSTQHSTLVQLKETKNKSKMGRGKGGKGLGKGGAKRHKFAEKTASELTKLRRELENLSA